MPSILSRRNLVVFIVFIALLLDNLLLTCIVPIIPNYLRDRRASSSSPDNDVSPHIHDVTEGSRTYDPPTNSMHKDLTSNYAHQRYALPLAHHVHDISSNRTDPQENTRIGLLIGTKTFVQLIANFGIGALTNRIGYTIPMFSGFVILLFSTLLFAFANSYQLLFTARAIQGIGTALSSTSGMGLLASLFPDQRERGLAQTIAFSGLAAGVLIGPPYGGVLYDWTGGKEIPILILAGVTLFEGVLQLLVIRPRYEPEEKKGSSFLKLLADPYILVVATSLTMSSLTVAVIEPVLPIWMYHTMNAPAWMQGVAFIPSTLSYLLALQIFGTIAHRCQCYDVSHRWLSALIGIVLLGTSITAVPFCKDIYGLIAPLFVNGLGLALVTSSMLPHVGYLVDHRHEPVYGSAYALTDNAFCLAFAIGPSISGPMVDTIGFSWTLISMGALSVATAPLVCFLRNVPGRRQESTEEQREHSPLLPKIVSSTAYAEENTMTTSYN